MQYAISICKKLLACLVEQRAIISSWDDLIDKNPYMTWIYIATNPLCTNISLFTWHLTSCFCLYCVTPLTPHWCVRVRVSPLTGHWHWPDVSLCPVLLLVLWPLWTLASADWQLVMGPHGVTSRLTGSQDDSLHLISWLGSSCCPHWPVNTMCVSGVSSCLAWAPWPPTLSIVTS